MTSASCEPCTATATSLVGGPRWIRLLLVVLLTMGFTGGFVLANGHTPADGQTSENARVAKVIAAYEDATRDGDLRRLCAEVLSFSAPDLSSGDMPRRGCADSADLASEVSEAQKQGKSYGLRVRKVRVQGSKATATVAVRGTFGQHVEPFFLARRAGRWRVAARGRTVAHTGSRIFTQLDCSPRTISQAVLDMPPGSATSARAFLTSFLGINARRRPASLIRVGIDYRASTRTFVYRTRGDKKKLAVFVVTGVNPYLIDALSFCRGSAGPYPDGFPAVAGR